MILKEYNLNLINLSSLIEDEVIIEINNFIIINNLKVSLSSKDTKRIFLHFLLKTIINKENILYDNVFIYNNLCNTTALNLIYNQENTIDFFNKMIKLIKSNFNITFLIKKEINFNKIQNSDFNEIYKLKNLLEKENSKNKNLQKSRNFCEKNGLMDIYSLLIDNKSKIFKLNRF
jgi:hypothetical protein